MRGSGMGATKSTTKCSEREEIMFLFGEGSNNNVLVLNNNNNNTDDDDVQGMEKHLQQKMNFPEGGFKSAWRPP